MATLLVIDDEPNVLYSLEKSLRSDTLTVRTARTAREGIEMVRQQPPDAVLLDIRLSDMSGLDAFDRIREIDPRLPVVLITAFASTELAIEAMKRGAYEYLLKPVDFHLLRETLARAIELSHLQRVPAVFEEGSEEGGVRGDTPPPDRIVGQAPAMQEVYKAIGRVALLDVPVLITGESGTGKELVARAIYHHSRRADKPFLPMNCAAIPETLLESELFGHERGAFTGADRRRIGKFEQAHGGTLFLDEIGDMTSATQPKVLRLLQEQEFERVGGNETIRTDVRILAATNQDLEALVARGRFRQDLFYRLRVFTIHLPNLRERLEDLPLLVAYFIKVLNRTLGKQVRAASAETLERLKAHSWPGNVRELQSAIKYAYVRAAGEVLTPDCLPENIGVVPAVRSGATPAEGVSLDLGELVSQMLRNGENDIYRKVSLAVDRVVLEAVLRHVKGSQVQASDLLGISRTTLRAKLRAIGVVRQLFPDTETGE